MDGPGGSDRDERSTEPLRGIGGSILAVCAVFAVIGVLIVSFGNPTGDKPAREGQSSMAGRSGRTATPTPTATPPSSRPPPPSAATVRPTPTTPARPTASAAPSRSAPPTASPTRSSRPAPRGPVIVYNQTVYRGLAARFGAELSAEGWTVEGTDTWRGNVPATTVYYPDGRYELARTLMDEHPEVGRIRAAVLGMSESALTVILCKDFPVDSLAAPAPGGTGDGGLAAAPTGTDGPALALPGADPIDAALAAGPVPGAG